MANASSHKEQSLGDGGKIPGVSLVYYEHTDSICDDANFRSMR